MNVLVFNCGSSSQSARVYRNTNGGEPEVIAVFKAKNVDTPTAAVPSIKWQIGAGSGILETGALTHRGAAAHIIALLMEHNVEIDAIGHRFVHGGQFFSATVRINPGTLEKLSACLPLAPIHNPNSYSVIEVCLERLPGAAQYAVFDTAFHAGLPADGRAYALPRDLVEKYGYHKVGFHGLSCQYVSVKAAELLGKPHEQVRLILCHLGTGGSSVTAFAEGKSQDTSMGFSPLAGLVMSTRAGDVDPGILIDMMRQGMSADEIETLLNHRSGLVGLSGYSSNLEEIITRADEGDADCALAFAVYFRRLRNYIGAYLYALDGADAIVFTDGIGVRSWKLREAALKDAANLGVVLDLNANRRVKTDEPAWIHNDESKVKLLVLPTDEERVIFDEVMNNFVL